MLVMENSEEVLQILERYSKLKPKEIPKELEEYLCYVAKTGDTLYRWFHVKILFREKLIRVIKDFHENTPSIDDLPQYPNVDPFNYESMKSALLERLELFNAAPFTVQRLSELLTDPKKQYNRVDKFMRALEKNILVVSTVEPGRKLAESENGDSLDSATNGDLSLDVNVEIDMEGGESLFNDDVSQAPIKSDISLLNVGGNEVVTLSNDENKTASNDMKISDKKDDKPNTDILQIECLRPHKEVPEPIENVEKIPQEKKMTIECRANTNKCEDNAFHKINKNLDDLSHSPDTTNKGITESSVVLANWTESVDEKLNNEKNDISKELTRNTIHHLKLNNALIDIDKDPGESEIITQNKESEPIGENIEISVEKKDVTQDKGSEENDNSEKNDNSEENDNSLDHEARSKQYDELTTSENIETILNTSQEQMSVEESSLSNVADKPVCAVPQIPLDQVMDDNLESTSHHPTNSSCNEVMMHSETDMTTDVGKVDTARMDIDDTSQEEAMDQ